jgi:hypothetical protein
VFDTDRRGRIADLHRARDGRLAPIAEMQFDGFSYPALDR